MGQSTTFKDILMSLIDSDPLETLSHTQYKMKSKVQTKVQSPNQS